MPYTWPLNSTQHTQAKRLKVVLFFYLSGERAVRNGSSFPVPVSWREENTEYSSLNCTPSKWNLTRRVRWLAASWSLILVGTQRTADCRAYFRGRAVRVTVIDEDLRSQECTLSRYSCRGKLRRFSARVLTVNIRTVGQWVPRYPWPALGDTYEGCFGNFQPPSDLVSINFWPPLAFTQINLCVFWSNWDLRSNISEVLIFSSITCSILRGFFSPWNFTHVFKLCFCLFVFLRMKIY